MKNSIFEVDDLNTIAPKVEIQEMPLPEQNNATTKTTKDWTFKGTNGEKKISFSKVITKQHALLRWNNRIGPKITLHQLSNLMKYICLYEPERLEMVNAKQLNGEEFNYFILDDDIVAIYTIENNKLTIITFLGRLSLKPQLQSVAALYTFITVGKDNTDLQVADEVLEAQPIPFGPTKAVIVDKKTTYYQLEFENEIAILKTSPVVNKRYAFTLVMLKHRHNMNLNILDLMVILNMGNKKFVAKYISTNYKGMPDLCEHYSNKALFNFKQKVLYKRGKY